MKRLRRSQLERHAFDFEMLKSENISMRQTARAAELPRSGIAISGSFDAAPLAPARWDWTRVQRILVVRLRSIGDTVLATPALHALRRFLPDAKIDLLLEDWVAPVLEGCAETDEIITMRRGSLKSRLMTMRRLYQARYDVAYNLHGGSTSIFLARASNAAHRVGYAHYRYDFLQTDNAPSPYQLWHRKPLHSVEQQLALLGFTGVPVTDLPPTKLNVTERAQQSLDAKLRAAFESNGHIKNFEEANGFAVIHPAAAFETKRWAAENFARVIEHLCSAHKMPSIIVAAPNEAKVVNAVLQSASNAARTLALVDLTLPEVTAILSRAKIFIGNDSGIAHIANAVGAPCVVVFGSSNVAHWQPWTPDAESQKRAAVVHEAMLCAPCAGYQCAQFEQPECIRRVKVEAVIAAIERILEHEMISAKR
jgi:lipopolysaccharide heptosyltransferase II